MVLPYYERLREHKLEIGMRKSEEWVENDDQASLFLDGIGYVGEQPMYVDSVRPLCLLRKGKESSNRIYISLV